MAFKAAENKRNTAAVRHPDAEKIRTEFSD